MAPNTPQEPASAAAALAAQRQRRWAVRAAMWTYTKGVLVCTPAVLLILGSSAFLAAGFCDAMGWVERHRLQPAPGCIEWAWCGLWLGAFLVGVLGLRVAVRKARVV